MIDSAIRYDVKGKRYIDTPVKYYFTDMGLRNARLNFRQIEETHSMENIISERSISSTKALTRRTGSSDGIEISNFTENKRMFALKEDMQCAKTRPKNKVMIFLILIHKSIDAGKYEVL